MGSWGFSPSLGNSEEILCRFRALLPSELKCGGVAKLPKEARRRDSKSARPVLWLPHKMSWQMLLRMKDAR